MSDLIERITKSIEWLEAAANGCRAMAEHSPLSEVYSADAGEFDRAARALRDCRAELAGREGMIKPSWDDAPEWADWLAQDECGVWFWYELKPHTHPQRKWVGPSLSVRAHSQGVRNRAADAGGGKPNPNWKDTLEKRPPTPEGQDVEDSHAE